MGKSKGSHPGALNVPKCSPLGNGLTNHTRCMPIHTRITHLHTVSHPFHILVGLVGPAEGHWCTVVNRVVLLLVGLGAFGRRVHLPRLPSNQQMLLAHCLMAQSGPTAGSPANPTIQFQMCESSANHTLESYHLFKFPGLTREKQCTYVRTYMHACMHTYIILRRITPIEWGRSTSKMTWHFIESFF